MKSHTKIFSSLHWIRDSQKPQLQEKQYCKSFMPLISLKQMGTLMKATKIII